MRAAKKRSVTVRADVDDAIVETVGARGYSAFVNDALVMALQAEGIAHSAQAFEREFGPITESHLRVARRRRAGVQG